MTNYEQWLQELERQYPEKKPVCLNYATARELILRLARENIVLRRMAVGQLAGFAGCSPSDCRKALAYADGDVILAAAYLKAKGLAVATPGMTFDERVQWFYRKELAIGQQPVPGKAPIAGEQGSQSDLMASI